MRTPLYGLLCGLAVLAGAAPVCTAPAHAAGAVCPEAGAHGRLTRRVHYWNVSHNRGPEGRPILLAYDEAERQIEAGQIAEALALLDQVVRERHPAAQASGLLASAAFTADELRRLCAPIEELPPLPAGVKTRRKLSASPKFWWE